MGQLFDARLIWEYFPKILSRLHITLGIVLLATLIGFLLGTILALFRLYKVPVLNQLTLLFVSFNRGTPVIVQLFIVFYGLPILLLLVGVDINRWDKLNFVIIAYGLNAAAFMSEIIRAAIMSVSVGQTEAAYSVGMTRYQAFIRIVAPQSVVIALPSLGTNMVGLLQDTSIAFSLGIVDVIGKVRAIGANTYHTMEGYIGASIIFIILSIMLEKLFSFIEKRAEIKRS